MITPSDNQNNSIMNPSSLPYKNEENVTEEEPKKLLHSLVIDDFCIEEIELSLVFSEEVQDVTSSHEESEPEAHKDQVQENGIKQADLTSDVGLEKNKDAVTEPEKNEVENSFEEMKAREVIPQGETKEKEELQIEEIKSLKTNSVNRVSSVEKAHENIKIERNKEEVEKVTCLQGEAECGKNQAQIQIEEEESEKIDSFSDIDTKRQTDKGTGHEEIKVDNNIEEIPETTTQCEEEVEKNELQMNENRIQKTDSILEVDTMKEVDNKKIEANASLTDYIDHHDLDIILSASKSQEIEEDLIPLINSDCDFSDTDLNERKDASSDEEEKVELVEAPRKLIEEMHGDEEYNADLVIRYLIFPTLSILFFGFFFSR